MEGLEEGKWIAWTTVKPLLHNTEFQVAVGPEVTTLSGLTYLADSIRRGIENKWSCHLSIHHNSKVFRG
jgi:hypothetical protein